MTQKVQYIKSRERVKKYGEVFTPPRVVKDMCDLCEDCAKTDIRKPFDIDSRTLDPACGTGNFLVEILERKFAKTNGDEYLGLFALASTYGVDVLEDNVVEARRRLRDMYVAQYPHKDSVLDLVDLILSENVIHADFLTGLVPNTDERATYTKWTTSDDFIVVPMRISKTRIPGPMSQR